MQPGDVLYVPSTVVAKIIRVISPVTNITGQAAGSAAALSLRQGVMPRQLDIAQLQRTLEEQGMELGLSKKS